MSPTRRTASDTLVGSEGAGAHDLLRMARRARLLDYLEARQEPGKTRARTVYALTGKGVEAPREWAWTPAQVTPFKSEPLVRLLIADLVGEGPTRASIAALRDDIAELSAQLDEAEASAATLPHRRKYLLLSLRFLRGLLDLHLELMGEVQRELDPKGRARRL